jgi:cysteine desulfuration protein SufE
LIDLGKSLEGLSDSERRDEYLVQGCTSQVWLICEEREGRLHLRADSDAFIVRGLVAILLSAYTGKSREEALAVQLDQIFNQIGLERNLSVSRRNGFASMIERVKSWAHSG